MTIALRRETVNSYLDALDRLKLTENSPAWKPHVCVRAPNFERRRSATSSTRRWEPPRALDHGISLCRPRGGRIPLRSDDGSRPSHLCATPRRQATPGGSPHGRKEVDAIIDTPDGWAAFEVKLTGDQNVIDTAAKGLLNFAANVDTSKHGRPAARAVVTATGGGGKRTDGGPCRADFRIRP